MFGFLEAVIILGLIGLQLAIAYKLWFKIEEYCDIYNIESLPSTVKRFISKGDFDSVDSSNIVNILSGSFSKSELKNKIDIIYLEDKEHNKTLSTIIKYVNVYLIKNRGGAVDFHIIKDIVDKHTETLENQIDNRVPAPLYLGLAATMLGIILGLFSVNFGDTDIGINSIQPLIDGVKWAMSASVIGLIITTYFSIKKYKDAQIEVDEEKNEFLSKLQAELMPKMTKGKLPEVSMLSNKLDSFATTTIGAVSQLEGIVLTSSRTVHQEQELLAEIRDLDVKKIASANVKVFSKLEGMMGSFNNFAKYYEELDKSMLGTTELLSNLKQFISNSQNINVVLEEIKDNIKLSNEATVFFSKHIHSFETYNDSVNQAVGDSHSAFNEAISQLKKAIETQIGSFNIEITNYDAKLKNVLDDQVARTEQAFATGRPTFEKLVKLDKLDSIDERLVNIEETLSITISKGDAEVISAIDRLSSSLKESKSNAVISNEGEVHNNIIEQPKKRFLYYVETILKLSAYIVIITYGIFLLLSYFELI